MDAVVCGGGPSLISDLAQCTGVKIACNHHAHVIGLDTEYLLYTSPKVLDFINGYQGKLIDYKRYNGGKIRMFGYAGTAAVVFALHHLNADNVYIAGCDLYTGPTKYCHPYDGPSGNEIRHINNHPVWWRQCLEWLGDDAKKLIPISGPLVDLCK